MDDYHVHLHEHGPYSGTGPPLGEYRPGLIESYVESEPRRDLAEETAAMVLADRRLSLEGYVAAVLDAKGRGLPVKLGLEIDFFPETIEVASDAHSAAQCGRDADRLVAEAQRAGYSEYLQFEERKAIARPLPIANQE